MQSLDTVTSHKLEIEAFPSDPVEKPWLITGKLPTLVNWNDSCDTEIFTAQCKNCILLDEIQHIFHDVSPQVETIKMEEFGNNITIHFRMSFTESERNSEKIYALLNGMLERENTKLILPGHSSANWTLDDGNQINTPTRIRYRFSTEIPLNLVINEEIENCITYERCTDVNAALSKIFQQYQCAFKMDSENNVENVPSVDTTILYQTSDSTIAKYDVLLYFDESYSEQRIKYIYEQTYKSCIQEQCAISNLIDYNDAVF